MANLAKSEQAEISVEDQEIINKLKMLDLTIFDLRLLKVLRPYVEEEIDQIARNFYASFYEIEPLKQINNQYSLDEKLSKALSVHIMDLFSGMIDDTFLGKRYRVGKIHYKIALKTAYYIMWVHFKIFNAV